MGTLRVVSPSARVQRLFEITGVNNYLEIRDTVKHAVIA
ncbi:hypothetical protein SALBM135S_05852 [Streptomyces alboniger]